MFHLSKTVTSSTKSRSIANRAKVIGTSFFHLADSETTTKRNHHAVTVQLDYYMSPQFAGVAAALVEDTYARKGLDKIEFLPICPVGLEQENVRIHQNNHESAVTVGTVEQNIFSPTLERNPHLKTTAIAAMFAKSPLCIASLPSAENSNGLSFSPDLIGAHDDTVELLSRIFPEHKVVGSPRPTKVTDLMEGKLGAIQAYTTTETPTLRMKLGEEAKVVELEGYRGTKLGYSQVVFTADECLEDDRKDILAAFCEATFEGWSKVISNPQDAVAMVREAKKMTQLDDESNDHWFDSDEFELEMVQRCSEYVKGTLSQSGSYGVIDASRWSKANNWLLEKETKPDFGLDDSVWK